MHVWEWRIAFHYGRDIHVIEVDGSEVTRLTTDPDNGMYPSWTPDGSQILFMSWRAGAKPDQTEIYRMNANGSEQQRLTETGIGVVIDPRVSPDGTKIAYVWVPNAQLPFGPKLIHVMDVDGANQTLLSGTSK